METPSLKIALSRAIDAAFDLYRKADGEPVKFGSTINPVECRRMETEFERMIRNHIIEQLGRYDVDVDVVMIDEPDAFTFRAHTSDERASLYSPYKHTQIDTDGDGQ